METEYSGILGVILSKTINLEALRTNPSHGHMCILHLQYIRIQTAVLF